MFLKFQFLRKTHSQKSRYILQSVAIVYTLGCIVSWIYKQKDKAAVISYSPFTILSNSPFFGEKYTSSNFWAICRTPTPPSSF